MIQHSPAKLKAVAANSPSCRTCVAIARFTEMRYSLRLDLMITTQTKGFTSIWDSIVPVYILPNMCTYVLSTIENRGAVKSRGAE
jgi:hypothetical protein